MPDRPHARGLMGRSATTRSPRQILDLFAEDSWRINVYGTELEVRPPGAPTTEPDSGRSRTMPSRWGRIYSPNLAESPVSSSGVRDCPRQTQSPTLDTMRGMEMHAHVPQMGKTLGHWLLEGVFIVISIALG